MRGATARSPQDHRMRSPLLPLLTALLFAISLAACSADNPAIPVVEAPLSEEARVVMAAMDPREDPCRDFYQYACGGWLREAQIPADQHRWTRSFSVIAAQTRLRLRELLEQPVALIGGVAAYEDRPLVYWQTCMDEPLVEQLGLSPIQPWLDRAASVQDATDVARLTAELHSHGLTPLFVLRVGPDHRAPRQHIVHLSQGGLGLPERSYYLDESSRMAAIRSAYRAHLERVFRILGDPQPDAILAAEHVLALETSMARASSSREALRDPDANYLKITFQEAEDRTPGLPLSAYFFSLGIAPPAEVNLRQPAFFQELAGLLASSSPDRLRAYMRWHIARGTFAALHEQAALAHFDFYGRTLQGVDKPKPRWERCIESLDATMPEALGRLYIARYFTPEARKTVREMVDDIKVAFQASLGTVSWLDDATRRRANQKIRRLVGRIGHPDAWIDDQALRISAQGHVYNVLAAQRFDWSRRLARLGRPVEGNEWAMSPVTVNAYYTPFGNQIVFPAGILQPPFFSEQFSPAMNFGALGMIIGHEMMHGFDDTGRKYDEVGRLTQWWSDGAQAAFEERAACVERLYSSIEIAPDLHINGKLTLGENIADLGGIKAAWGGWQRYRERHPGETSPVPGLTPEQLFFVSFAQSWCGLAREEELRVRTATDTHAPSRARVNVTLSQTPMFHQTFQCAPQTAMHPIDRCEVW
jgi:predicted metalloendopeptidase